MKRLLLALALGLICATAFGDNFKTDIDGAIRAATKDKKNLVVVVTGPRCIPCQTMKARIEDLERRGEVEDFHVAYVEFDSEKGRKLYKGQGVPQLDKFIYLDGKWYRYTRLGLMSQEMFLEFANGKKD